MNRGEKTGASPVSTSRFIDPLCVETGLAPVSPGPPYLSGHLFWPSFLAVFSGHLFRPSFLAVFSGRLFWPPFLAVFSGRLFRPSFLAVFSGRLNSKE